MVIKIEPGLYSETHGGVRWGDVVAVTENGAEVLTRFHWDLDDTILPGAVS
jgi:Xaa-Pro aminopeptidase